MNSADQLLSARIAAVARRHTRRGVVDDLDSGVAELGVLARDRPDLLEEHAGLALGTAEGGLPELAPQFRAEADLCVAAGADPGEGRALDRGRPPATEAAKQARTPEACSNPAGAHTSFPGSAVPALFPPRITWAPGAGSSRTRQPTWPARRPVRRERQARR